MSGLGFGVWGLGFGILLALSAGACAKARAETVPEGPPLQVPEPPQRVLAPVEDLAVPAPAPEPDTPAAAVAPPRAPVRPATESKPQPPLPAAPPPPPPVAGPRELRAAPPANAATERSVRETLARAARDINRVDYSRLSAEGRAQYEQSKRFSAQAEQALKERNLMFAATLADKAATLAVELLGR